MGGTVGGAPLSSFGAGSPQLTAMEQFGRAMQSGVSPQEAMTQLPFTAQRELPGGYEAKAAMDKALSRMMQREPSTLLGKKVPIRTPSAAQKQLLRGVSPMRKLMDQEAKALQKFSKPTAKSAAAKAAVGKGATVGVGVGTAAITGAAVLAAALIDRAMKKTFGSGLLPNAREGMRTPLKSAKGGLQFIKENLRK